MTIRGSAVDGPQESTNGSAAGRGGWWRRRRAAARERERTRDLRSVPSPMVSPADWHDPETTLQALHRHAEAKALAGIDWYLRERRTKRRASRLLRAAAIVLGAAGALHPLAVGPAAGRVQWGYLLLGLAATALVFDRFFGLSRAWLRCVLSAQRLQRRLELFQDDWTAACASELIGNGRPSVSDRLALLRAFSTDVTDIVRQETAEWEQEFHSTLRRLESQSVAPSAIDASLPGARRRLAAT
ncbi:MAG: SLATT domain-containing protein [Actinobacteria bacterium]|nr:SLATT domain-containing protein [Actinomycetota bacterium]